MATLQPGKTYRITCQRKGTFSMRVEKTYDDWVQGLIVEGEADAMLDYNRRGEAEEITVRASFITAAVEISTAH